MFSACSLFGLLLGGNAVVQSQIERRDVDRVFADFRVATTYGGAQYALHLATDPANSVETPVQYVNGLAGYYKTYGGGRNRWGDFSGTAFDPVDGSFWTFQEWANTGSNWGTQVAHMPQ